MIDIPYPEIQEKVRELRAILRKEKVLPYFPKEKKAKKTAYRNLAVKKSRGYVTEEVGRQMGPKSP